MAFFVDLNQKQKRHRRFRFRRALALSFPRPFFPFVEMKPLAAFFPLSLGLFSPPSSSRGNLDVTFDSEREIEGERKREREREERLREGERKERDKVYVCVCVRESKRLRERLREREIGRKREGMRKREGSTSFFLIYPRDIKSGCAKQTVVLKD